MKAEKIKRKEGVKREREREEGVEGKEQKQLHWKNIFLLWF